VRFDEPADHVEERRLAGSVGADDADHGAGLDVEADAIEGHEAAEADTDVADSEAAHGWASRTRRDGRASVFRACKGQVMTMTPVGGCGLVMGERGSVDPSCSAWRRSLR